MGVVHTRYNLNYVLSKRIYVYLSNRVYLMARLIETLEPEDHRCRRTTSVVELLEMVASGATLGGKGLLECILVT